MLTEKENLRRKKGGASTFFPKWLAPAPIKTRIARKSLVKQGEKMTYVDLRDKRRSL